MGNVALCVPSNGEIKILSTTTDARIAIYRKAPVKAGEIMLENPGQFLCESNDLKTGQRVPCIGAEEELEKGRFYFLLPMDMLYSVLTYEEMKTLTQKPSKVSAINFSKIFPDQLSCLFPNSNSNSNNGSEIKISRSVRCSRQRSWEPALETIIETPPHC
ncbi:hypothetical protein PHJA_000649300 [Phtheirospermum japonicum]|uniref:Uncharacterized protein n=1 Tax=Phtheirospermum japonicum TaxID=374723 RepID=A0A830BMG5_9LAMI|nr:hypothetical protein PHJA_000649300 [Phtheirospermum japonicum]